ncbi:MAG: hypothetical protein PHN44_01945 [Candidatus Marinimicrobia bacterium]|jgi:hypothetical protein|nr:hypothetical protein [Candidatus Neomarinimicrobiota bacterium]
MNAIPTEETGINIYEATEIADEQQFGELAFKVHQNIVNIIQTMHSEFLDLGEQAWITLKFGLWKIEAETVEQYVELPEISMSRSGFFQLAAIHEYFRIQLNMDKKELLEIGRKRLMLMLHKVTPENREELFLKAKKLSSRDFEIELRNSPTLTDGKTRDYNENIEKGYYRLMRVDTTDMDIGATVGYRKAEIVQSSKGMLIYIGDRI